MKRSELINTVRTYLEEPDSSYLTDAIIVSYANDFLCDIAEDVGFSHSDAVVDVEYEQGIVEIDRLADPRVVKWRDGQEGAFAELVYLTPSEFSRQVDDPVRTGVPRWYTSPTVGIVSIYPLPSQNGQLYVAGVFYPELIPVPMTGDSDDPETPIRKRHIPVFIAYCRYQLAAMQDDAGQASYWLETYKRGIKELRTRTFFSGGRPMRWMPSY